MISVQVGENPCARFDIVAPTGLEILADVDDVFIADLDAIISSLGYGLLGRFAAGEIAITDIVPALDRTVFYLTTGYEASQQKKRPPSRRGHQEGVSGRGVRR